MCAKAPRKPCTTPGCDRLARPYRKLCCHCDNQLGRRQASNRRLYQERHLQVVAYTLGLIPTWPFKRKYDLSNPIDLKARQAALHSRLGRKAITRKRLRQEGWELPEPVPKSRKVKHG